MHKKVIDKTVTSDKALQSDVLQLYKTYDPPPKDFDIRTASDKLLARYNIPRRPDPEREPKLARLWRRAFAHPPNFVKAELSIDPVMSKRNPLRRLGPGFGPTGWGGVVVDAAAVGPPATFVTADWVVPRIVSLPLETANLGFWVGLDGFGNGQVLQAGITATANALDWPNIYCWAWTEWYTDQYKDPAVQINNFSVSIGDTISVIVCAQQPDLGYVMMLNVSTGQATRVGIPARPGITSQGASAEWIVECPSSSEFPAFWPVTFNECAAGGNGVLFDLTPNGFPVNITGDGGDQLTQTFIASPDSAVVDWNGHWS